VIKFRKNFGQTTALQAGFDFASGDVVITMDADMQNDPADIPKLLEKIEENWDVVSGWRYERKDPMSKRLLSKIQNWLARRVTSLNIHDFGCSLKAYKKEVLKNVKLYGEMHRYIPALVSMGGFSITEVKVRHHPRKYGKTKYDLRRLLKGLLDLIYVKFWADYSTRPLHLFGLFGILLLVIGFVIGLYKVLIEFIYFGLPLELGPLLMLAVLLLIMGVQFMIFGFLGEIQIRTYYNTAKEPSYSIKEVIN
jgi:glycosyltransferase involved in cell wall biosynthesis